MEKRYQVFVSSTYDDLKEERLEVFKALLELDCFPSGMEYFPAASEDQWTYIKRLIEECDYYITIIAGRYGSTDGEGKSYTQKEYEYAVEKNIPVIAFIHGDLAGIPSRKSETEPQKIQRLHDFRELAKKRLCKHWTNTPDLGGVVSRSLAQLINRTPRNGWVRSDAITQLPNESAKKTRSLSFFSENYVNNSKAFQNSYRDCTELVVAGHAQNRMMVSYSSEIERILLKEGSVKILIMDPSGSAVETANLRSSNPSQLGDVRYQHKASLARLAALDKRRRGSGDFHVKLVDYVLPFTIYGFDISDNAKGTIFIWLTPFQEPSISRPGFSLDRENDEFWFDFFKEQFSRLWNWDLSKTHFFSPQD